MKRKNNIFRSLPIVAAHYGEKFGVKVVVGGSDAGTDGKTILVPNVPESYPNKDVVWGYLAHESSHVKHTDFDVWNSAATQSGLRQTLLNVFEDARIESEMMKRYPGVRGDLDATVTYLKDSGMFASVTADDEPGRILQAKMLYWLRANMLQQPIDDLAKTADVAMKAAYPEGVNTRLAVLLRKATKSKSTSDCLELTDNILSMLEEEAEKEEEKATPSKDQQDSTHPPEDGDSDDQTDQGQDDSDSGDDNSSSPSQDGDSDDSLPDGAEESTLSQEDFDAAQQAATQIRKALESKGSDLDADAFESLKKELCEEADLHGDDSYCTVPHAPDSTGNEVLGQELLSKVQSTTSKLRAQLMGLVQAARQNRDFARRSGRKLDSKRVTRILSGDTRIFRKRGDRVEANTAVHVLTDLSGSMNGHEEVVARETSLAIALALEAIPGVSPAVTYFSGGSSDPVRSAVRHGQSVRRNVSRFVEPVRGSTPMAEGIWFAAYELAKAAENRKLMIVITDGDPDNSIACHTVLDLCESAGIDTVGIGICHNRVQDIFDRSIVIHSINELRSTLFKLVKDKLTAEVA